PASALGFALSFRLSIFHFRFSIFFIPATFFPQRQQQIQIPHRLLAPPQRSRRCHRFHRLPRLLDVLDNRCCRLFRCADQESSRRLLEHLHRLQNILFALLSKPRQVPQLAFLRQFFDVRHRPGLERLPQHRHLFRPQRLQLQQIQDRLRIFLQQLLPQTVVARLHNFLQMLHHAVADPRQFRQLLRRGDHRLHRFRQPINQFRRLLIAPVAPDDRAINLQQARRFPQNSRYLFVFHARHYNPLSPPFSSLRLCVIFVLHFFSSFFPSFLLSFLPSFLPLCPLCSVLCDLCVTVPLPLPQKHNRRKLSPPPAP